MYRPGCVLFLLLININKYSHLSVNGPDVAASEPTTEVIIIICVAAVVGVVAIVLGVVCYFHYKRNR